MYLAYAQNSAIVDQLCTNIHLRQNAFILIFTIHHTQNRDLLDTILLHCVCSFDKVRPAQLSTGETQFMNDLLTSLPQSIISSASTKENRIEQRERKQRGLDRESEDDKPDHGAKSDEEGEEVSLIEIE